MGSTPANIPAAWLRGPTANPFLHPGDLLRRTLAVNWETEGVITDTIRDGANSLRVTANSTPNMALAVAQGEAVIWADGQLAALKGRGCYLACTTGVKQVAISPAGTATRIDLVVLEVVDETYAGAPGSSTVRLRSIEGAPGAGVPPLPDNAVPLAEVTVGANVTTITAAAVVDRRTVATRALESRLAALEVKPAARAKMATSASIPNASNIIVTCGLAEYDTVGNMAAGGGITIRKSGLYVVSCGAQFNPGNDTTGFRELALMRNGSTALGACTLPGTQWWQNVVTSQANLAVGDVLTVRVHQTSGNSLTTASAWVAAALL